MPETQIRIGNKAVGHSSPCYVIAEAGVNHNGSLARALEMVDVAARAGADAIKFQVFETDKLASVDAPLAEYQMANAPGLTSQQDLLRGLELNFEQHARIHDYCHEVGIQYLATPFDPWSLQFLERIGVEAYKVSSGDLTNYPFLSSVAELSKPMIVSTGMATLDEVGKAVSTVLSAGNNKLILLHCVSEYPALSSHANLLAMRTMAGRFGVIIGFSDHTLGETVCLAAVAMGAKVVEKHFTLDKSLPGPDHQASLEPAMLKTLVEKIREIESAFGTGEKLPTASEIQVAKVVRKSLFAAEDIAEGTVFSEKMIVVSRPGTGLSPENLQAFIGKTARIPIRRGTMLALDMVK